HSGAIGGLDHRAAGAAAVHAAPGQARLGGLAAGAPGARLPAVRPAARRGAVVARAAGADQAPARAFGRIRFSNTATTPHRLTPCSVMPSKFSARPPIPITSTEDTITRLRGSSRSTRALISVFRPTLATEPNISIMIPPITGTGIVASSALNLPKKAMMIASTAAQVMIAGLKFRVRVTAPVTSE